MKCVINYFLTLRACFVYDCNLCVPKKDLTAGVWIGEAHCITGFCLFFLSSWQAKILQQAKHDKSELSSKLPIEFQWFIGEIGKSLYEKYKSLYENVMQDFKLPIEKEKTLIKKKTDVAIYREININCWEWEISVWEKEITIRDYRLLFLGR